MKHDAADILKQHGVQPSAQRVAVARFVLDTDEHPSADRIFAKVKRAFPQISRATVYNTLNVMVEKGLLRELVLAPGRVVFDPKTDRHHHFIDADSGRIHDVPWDAVDVGRIAEVPGFDVSEYQVVMRGHKKGGPH